MADSEIPCGYRPMEIALSRSDRKRTGVGRFEIKARLGEAL
jgi:hypothetical protein